MKFAGIILLSVIISAGTAVAQSGVFRDSVFDAELMKVLVHQSERGGTPDLPTLTLTAQYSRHRPFDDQPAYERGPYDLTQQIFRSSYTYDVELNTLDNHSIDLNDKKSHPTASSSVRDDGISARTIDVAPYPVSWYVGGMVVRSARVGDMPNDQDAGDNYLIRVAAVPVKYSNDTLWLLTLLQRATMPAKNAVTGIELPAKDISIVYQKLIDITGHDPLTLRLPPVDPQDETEEDVTISLETPQGFGLAKNVPDTVVTRTMFAYAIPKQCNVKLTVAKTDGTVLDTLVHRIEEAGVYRSVWDASKYAAGTYYCSMEATPVPDGAPFYKQMS
ncbi:MAG TPA: hypothetical protein VFJ29_00900, partial [Candidatus Kapabacteria bacterium]|nr:hypothetical protein [Candidatus Kapabacteria bacterium]